MEPLRHTVYVWPALLIWPPAHPHRGVHLVHTHIRNHTHVNTIGVTQGNSTDATSVMMVTQMRLDTHTRARTHKHIQHTHTHMHTHTHTHTYTLMHTHTDDEEPKRNKLL